MTEGTPTPDPRNARRGPFWQRSSTARPRHKRASCSVTQTLGRSALTGRGSSEATTCGTSSDRRHGAAQKTPQTCVAGPAGRLGDQPSRTKPMQPDSVARRHLALGSLRFTPRFTAANAGHPPEARCHPREKTNLSRLSPFVSRSNNMKAAHIQSACFRLQRATHSHIPNGERLLVPRDRAIEEDARHAKLRQDLTFARGGRDLSFGFISLESGAPLFGPSRAARPSAMFDRK